MQQIKLNYFQNLSHTRIVNILFETGRSRNLRHRSLDLALFFKNYLLYYSFTHRFFTLLPYIGILKFVSNYQSSVDRERDRI